MVNRLTIDAVATHAGCFHRRGLYVAERMLEKVDWAGTPLGAQRTWTPALRYAVTFCLASRFPMLLWWGPELIQIYNDGFVPLLGKRHPSALGQRAADCWPEAWDVIGPNIERTRATGEPFWAEDMMFKLERNGFVEEAYFTYSYSRIEGDDERDRGVLCSATETTQAVLRGMEFRSMADSLAHIVYTHSPDGTIDWVNARWHEYTRLPPDMAMTPEGWARVLHPADARIMRAGRAAAFAESKRYGFEARIRPDGAADEDYRWFHFSAVPMRASNGAIFRWAGTATDVHDRRVAENALRAQFDREHAVSLAFQRAALPKALPDLPGLDFHAVYEPAGAEALVGGDWYDAFQLPDGRIVLSVGDVVGSGSDAAITMAAVRQAIRGAAQVYPDAVAILNAADLALGSEQPDRIVTAFLGMLDPLTLSFSYACAGHPAPLLRHSDGTIAELGAFGLPLGLREEKQSYAAVNASVTLPDRSLLVLYTDGLVESTHNIIEGDARLRRALGSCEVYEAADPATAIRRTVLTTVTDDVAILTLRVTAAPEVYSPSPVGSFEPATPKWPCTSAGKSRAF